MNSLIYWFSRFGPAVSMEIGKEQTDKGNIYKEICVKKRKVSPSNSPLSIGYSSPPAPTVIKGFHALKQKFMRILPITF